jgi:ADP-ribose pyrophosphatase YjhB (NUDIX family)
MPTPEFVLALRAKIGRDPLPLPGVTAVVFDDDGRVLLVKRADSGRWTLVTGILEPGEQPADGAARETAEETGVQVRAERILRVAALPMRACANGDQFYPLDVAFRCRKVSGEARVSDDECTEAGWFTLDALPDIPPGHLRHIHDAMDSDSTARFEGG